MMLTKILLFITLFLICSLGHAQYILPATQQTLNTLDELQLRNKSPEAFDVLEKAIKNTGSPTDLAYLYAHQSGMYIAADSLLKGKRLLDLSMENAGKSKSPHAKAIAYRAKAYLSNILNLPDAVVEDALTGLKYVEERNDDLLTKYHLHYLLYSAYSKWDDEEKMEKYIRICQQYAILANNINLQANVNNGMSSMFLARYKASGQQNLLDSSYHYLDKALILYQRSPDRVSGNTSVITCINLANYYLEFSGEDLMTRRQKAFLHLDLAEKKLRHAEASSEKWINVYGIKSGFAKKEGDFMLAEHYLLQGLSQLMNSSKNHFKLEYVVNKDLKEIALKNNDVKKALTYQQRAEDLLKKSFDEQQLFNAQKLEVQYETEKKDQQLKLLRERELFRKKQNYMYGGIAVALLFGFVFMFVSYHFRLKYALERETKLAKEKEDAEHQAALELKIEKEEQARLKAEQELLDLKRQQLEKEALANSLIIDHKNDMLKQIQGKIRNGDTSDIRKLLKEEMLLRADFNDVKMQIQELHPTFFQQLMEKAAHKLTPLDLKYCAYIYLQMTTKQIAQALHVEPQSVRMFKYRLKQKFGLGKDVDLEKFLLSLS
ncbi:helix-turn-helix transcriptional regulator [Sphingobacterium gobiense]|uniref:HTH luxR-type domain-containing protein n=1 Tax=Sphingobacterium gobiense TaxID=1382456 RepID=A0A2S9JL47_9SPHI|nr:hypothetical protein [Sphingobacterium gobiense]PRD53864.1 hypothetical protein C5749_10115 [Sphingobacterium gobiense]